MAVEGRVLVTATNGINTGSRGSFEDGGSPTLVSMVGLTANNSNGHHGTREGYCGNEGDNISYSNVDIGDRRVPLKRNEAYAATHQKHIPQ